MPTKRPLKNSQTVDTKIKIELGNDNSYPLSSTHAHASSVKEMDIFQQPRPGTSSLQNNWSHSEEKSNTKAVPFRTVKETLMAQKPWSKGFVSNSDWNHPEEHNDTKATQLQNIETPGNADPADPTTGSKCPENQNQTTIKTETRGKNILLGDTDYLNKNASSAARTAIAPWSTKTAMEIVNSAMSEYDKMTDVQSIGHLALKTKASPTTGIIMAPQPAKKINMETFNSTMHMCEYDRMTGVIYGGHGQGWSTGQVATKTKGDTTTPITDGISTQRITSRMSLVSLPQAKTVNQITYTFSNHPLPLPLVLSTGPDPNNRDIFISQNSGMDNSRGLEKIDEETCCININDFSFLKTPNPEKHETEPQATNVSTPKLAVVNKSEYDVWYLKTETPFPESPENSPQKANHLQSKDEQHNHPLHKARIIQQNMTPALKTSQTKIHHKKRGPHPNNHTLSHNKSRKNKGKALGPDELDWLIAYNRTNIPASGVLSQKYWKKAAEEFEKEFNKRQSPTSLAMRFSNGDIAARIRAKRSQANGVVPTAGERPWSRLENVWFAIKVGNKEESEIDFVELGETFQHTYGIERLAKEWEAKWHSEKRQRAQASKRKAKAKARMDLSK